MILVHRFLNGRNTTLKPAAVGMSMHPAETLSVLVPTCALSRPCVVMTVLWLLELSVLCSRVQALLGNPVLTGSYMGLFLLIGSPMVNLMWLVSLGPAVMPLVHRVGVRILDRTVLSRILFRTLCAPMPESAPPRLFMLVVSDPTLLRL